jgi:hypothetical protein
MHDIQLEILKRKGKDKASKIIDIILEISRERDMDEEEMSKLIRGDRNIFEMLKRECLENNLLKQSKKEQFVIIDELFE